MMGESGSYVKKYSHAEPNENCRMNEDDDDDDDEGDVDDDDDDVLIKPQAIYSDEEDDEDEPVQIEVEVDHTLFGEVDGDDHCTRSEHDVTIRTTKRKARTKCNCTDCNPDFSDGRDPVANIFECDICKKCFTKCKYYRRHKGLHSKTKTLKCDLCHVSFMFSYQLQSHRLTHTLGQKPFQCSSCNKSFTSKYYLKQHEWVHNPVTPFRCQVCGKGYSSEGYFKRHELSHLQ